MKVKFLKPYQFFAKDDVADLTRGIADLLIQRKVAELIEQQKKPRKLETKIFTGGQHGRKD